MAYRRGADVADRQVSLWVRSPTGVQERKWAKRGTAHSAGNSQQGYLIWETQKFGLMWFCWEANAKRENKRFSVGERQKPRLEREGDARLWRTVLPQLRVVGVLSRGKGTWSEVVMRNVIGERVEERGKRLALLRGPW